MTATATNSMRLTEDWPTDATTTMGEAPPYALNAPTTEPERHDTARPRAVRIPDDGRRFVAWAHIRELHDVHCTMRYDLELAAMDDAMLFGEPERVTSVSPAVHGIYLVFVYGRQVERPRGPRTPLGEHLWKLREKIVASGLPLFDWEELEREVQSRRGGAEAGDTA